MNSLMRRMDDLVLLVGAVFVLSLAVGVFTYTRPTTRDVVRELPYAQTGVVSYSADVSEPGLYDAGRATTGDAVFSRLSDKVTFGFRYQLSMSAPHALQGVVSLTAEVSEASGWKRTLIVAAETPFSGDLAVSEGSLSLSQLRVLTDSFAAATGVARPQFTVTVRPAVTVGGTAGGEVLDLRFKPALVFLLDEAGLRPAPGGDKGGDPYAPSEKSFLSSSERAPRTVSALAFQLTYERLRALVAAGLTISILTGAGLAIAKARSERSGPSLSGALARYADILVVADGLPPGGSGSVAVSSLADLVKVARAEGTVVAAYPVAGGAEYEVRGLTATYRHATTNPYQAEARLPA